MIEPENIVVILLAAGRSRRFGDSDKLLASLDGAPLVTRAAAAIDALKPGRRIAVCGSEDGEPARLLSAMGFDIVVNPAPERGLSTSIEIGIAAAEFGTARAALVCLADMPFVTTTHLRAMLRSFDQDAAPIVGSCRNGVALPPALFSRSSYQRLKSIRGDHGAKELLAGAPLVSASETELADVDRPEDLEAIVRAFNQSGERAI